MADFSDNLDDLGLTPDEKSLEPKEKIDELDSLSREDALAVLKKTILGSKKRMTGCQPLGSWVRPETAKRFKFY